MYTRCQHCHTWFRIGADALREGDGKVRCGHCLEVFNALHALREDLPAGEVEHSSADLEMKTEPANDGIVRWEAIEASLQLPSLKVVDVPPEAEPKPDPALAPELDTRVAMEPPLGDLGTIESIREPELSPMPDVLRADIERLEHVARARRQRGWLLAFAALLLMLLVGQYAWFAPEDMARRYPAARPWLERFCAHTSCLLSQRRDLGKMVVLGRDVRAHPRFEGALLVSAALSNTASFEQGWPRLQFLLFNVNGQTIASRVFEPEEYLDKGLPRKMPSGTPIQVGLELLATEEAAVSFEFRFL